MKDQKEKIREEIAERVIANKPVLTFLENGVECRTLSKETEDAIEQSIQKLNEYIEKTNTNNITGKEADMVYQEAQILWNECSSLINKTTFNFYMNRTEYNFLTELLNRRFEYSVETIFFAFELIKQLHAMKEIGGNYTNDLTPIAFPLTATDVTMIYHLLTQHKVKGLDKSAYTFASILRRIGTVSKVFGYYENEIKTMSTTITTWISEIKTTDEELV